MLENMEAGTVKGNHQNRSSPNIFLRKEDHYSKLVFIKNDCKNAGRRELCD